MTAAPAPSHGATVLRADGVHVRYRIDRRRAPRRGQRSQVPLREIHAVQGVSLELRSGESLAIVGENGAGKSTLLSALAGLMPLAQGSVAFVEPPRLLSVGAVLQSAWTGRESIRVGLAALRVPRDERAAVEDDIARFTGLHERLDLPVRTYSRGMRGRLLFAINTAVPAGILLVDEALGGADGRFRARAQKRLEALLSASGSLIVASHSRTTLERICSRAVLLRQGQVAIEGTVAEVFAAYEG